MPVTPARRVRNLRNSSSEWLAGSKAMHLRTRAWQAFCGLGAGSPETGPEMLSISSPLHL